MNIKLKSRNHESPDISIDIEIVYVSLSNILNDFFFFKYLQHINQDVSQIVSFEQLGRVPDCSNEQLGTRPNCPNEMVGDRLIFFIDGVDY